MATLTGKITDVTSKAPESISSITVKAPSARIGGGTDVIVSSPAIVDFNQTTGDITISNLTGGLSWLYIEGNGWVDSIPLAVADGMITLVEAIANAAGTPGLVDFIALLTDLQNRIDAIAQDAVDDAAAQYVGVSNLGTTHLDQVSTPGRYAQPIVANATTASGYPVTGERVNLFVVPMNENAPAQVMQILVVKNTGAMWTRDYISAWNEWKSPTAEAAWFKGDVPSGTTSISQLSNGLWNVPTAILAETLGLPTYNYGSLEIIGGSAKTATWRPRLTANWNAPEVWQVNSSTGGTWFDWEKINTGITNLDADQHLNDIRRPDTYAQVIDTNATIEKGYPFAGVRQVIEVERTNANDKRQVLQTAKTLDGRVAVRHFNAIWQPWETQTGGGAPGVVSNGDLFVVDTDGLTHEFESPDLPADDVTATLKAADIYARYDALVTAHPNYVSRRNLGAASNGTSIYAYTFKRPEVPYSNTNAPDASKHRDLPVGLITSGVHGHESAAVSHVLRFAETLCNSWQDNPLLDAIRWNAELIIVPVVNPHGLDGRYDSQVWARQNANGVDINRNFPAGWFESSPGTGTYGGEAPLTEPETQAVWALMQEVAPRAVFGSDFHNFSTNEPQPWGFFWEIYSHPMTMEVGKAVINLMSRRWRAKHDWITVPDQHFGYLTESPGGTLSQAFSSLGIPGCTMETSNLQRLDGGAAVDYDARSTTLGFETVVNHIGIALREGIRRKPGVSD